MPGVDTARAVCLEHAICIAVCALISGPRALTASHLKRVITASSLPGSGLRSRWQAAGSVVLVGAGFLVLHTQAPQKAPCGWGSCETSGEPGVERAQEHLTGGPWCCDAPWSYLPLGRLPRGVILSAIPMPSRRAGCLRVGGRVQCGPAGGRLMLHFCPCFSQLSALSISPSSPSAACRLTPSGGLEASLVSSWTEWTRRVKRCEQTRVGWRFPLGRQEGGSWVLAVCKCFITKSAPCVPASGTCVQLP